jgi:type VI secretion system protein VasD
MRRLTCGSRLRIPALVALLALLDVGASPAPAQSPSPGGETTLELTIVGGPDLNPNSQGRASPVVVRIFDLAATKAFAAADFQTLFDQPSDSLKRDIAAQEELILRPGDIEQRDRSLPPTVVAVGVAAGFRDLEHALWRLTVAVKPGRHNLVLIDLHQNKIRVETLDAGHS